MELPGMVVYLTQWAIRLDFPKKIDTFHQQPPTKEHKMQLITEEVMKEAQKRAISSRADDIEKKVVKKLHQAMLQPSVEEKLLALLENKSNIELSTASIIRSAQMTVNRAFKNRGNYADFSKSIFEAMELLALSLVVADEDEGEV